MIDERRQRVLLINTGSSSVKLTVWGDGRALVSEKRESDDVVDLARFVEPFGPIAAVAHRIVHAGDIQRHTVITAAVEKAIRAASPLAPLHNPMALHYVAKARAVFGTGVPQLAAVDTAFFADLPEHATSYALPPEVGPVRRYGFHGLAHAFMARRCAELDRRRPRRVISVQLGAGCSAAAVMDGKAMDTSMGFSPSEGLMMASRSGDVDPGLLIHLVRTRGYSADDLNRMINERGGLLGVCGYDAMPSVLQNAAAGDQRAQLAIALYCHRVRKTIGAYAAVLGGVDALVFGGGVGENAAEIRQRIVEPLTWLGFDFDRANNTATPVDAAITTKSSKAWAWVIHLDEAEEMAQIASALLRAA